MLGERLRTPGSTRAMRSHVVDGFVGEQKNIGELYHIVPFSHAIPFVRLSISFCHKIWQNQSPFVLLFWWVVPLVPISWAC